MLDFIKNLFGQLHFTGLIPDPRKYYEKDKDYKDSERVASAPVYASTKLIDSPYFRENQNYTSSCVPHASVLALVIEFSKIGFSSLRLSQMFPYRHRSNYPSPGSYLDEILNFLVNNGSCLFDTLSTPFNEQEANGIVITDHMAFEAKKYEGVEYYHMDNLSIDNIAARASEGRGVPILIYATEKEYSQKYVYPTDFVLSWNAPIRHCICVLPHGGFIENGKKYLAVQDSAWFGGINLRYLSEDFIAKRAFGAGYFNQAKFTAQVKPQHTFTQILTVGSTGPEVLWLQKCLNYEGLLPDDCLTGNFFGRTLQATKDFQAKYKDQILVPNGLTEPTGIVGKATNSVLNQRYA